MCGVIVPGFFLAVCLHDHLLSQSGVAGPSRCPVGRESDKENAFAATAAVEYHGILVGCLLLFGVRLVDMSRARGAVQLAFQLTQKVSQRW